MKKSHSTGSSLAEAGLSDRARDQVLLPPAKRGGRKLFLARAMMGRLQPLLLPHIKVAQVQFQGVIGCSGGMVAVATAAIVFWVSQVLYKCLGSCSVGNRDGTPELTPVCLPERTPGQPDGSNKSLALS